MKTFFIIISFLLYTGIVFSQQPSVYLDNTIISKNDVKTSEISKDGRFLAYGDELGGIYLYDISSKREIRKLSNHTGEITFLLFDSENKYLISSGKDNKIIIWDLYSGNLLKTLEEFDSEAYYLDLSPDNRLLIACGKSDDILIWDFPIGKLKGTLKGHKDDVVFASFNLNGDQILSISEDKQMIVWNPAQMKQIRKTQLEPTTIKNSGIDVISARCSPDKYFVALGIEEHALAKDRVSMIFNYYVTFFDWNTGRELKTIQGSNKKIEFFCTSPDKNYIITDNSTLRETQFSIWNIQKGIAEQTYELSGDITSVDFCENGKYVVISYKDKSNSGVNVYQVSGVSGYDRFNQNQVVIQKMNSEFGESCKLTISSEPLLQLGEKKKLAVTYFVAQGITEDAAKIATSLLEGKLVNSKYVTLIERNQINKVLDELKIQISGLNESSAVDIGKQLNANYILIGTLNKLGSTIILTTKLVNVETAQIEGVREVQCLNATIENINDMVSMLAPTIVKF